MSNLWKAIVAFLVWLSADRAELDLEQPRAAAAVAAARASMAREAPAPQPAPAPPAPQPRPPSPSGCRCGCVNGKIKPDGRIEIPCECSPGCTCKRAACPNGRCPPAPR